MSIGGVLLGLINIGIVVAILLLIGVIAVWIWAGSASRCRMRLARLHRDRGADRAVHDRGVAARPAGGERAADQMTRRLRHHASSPPLAVQDPAGQRRLRDREFERLPVHDS